MTLWHYVGSPKYAQGRYRGRGYFDAQPPTGLSVSTERFGDLETSRTQRRRVRFNAVRVYT